MQRMRNRKTRLKKKGSILSEVVVWAFGAQGGGAAAGVGPILRRDWTSRTRAPDKVSAGANDPVDAVAPRPGTPFSSERPTTPPARPLLQNPP